MILRRCAEQTRDHSAVLAPGAISKTESARRTKSIQAGRFFSTPGALCVHSSMDVGDRPRPEVAYCCGTVKQPRLPFELTVGLIRQISPLRFTDLISNVLAGNSAGT
jgi:hypothetical protein